MARCSVAENRIPLFAESPRTLLRRLGHLQAGRAYLPFCGRSRQLGNPVLAASWKKPPAIQGGGRRRHEILPLVHVIDLLPCEQRRPGQHIPLCPMAVSDDGGSRSRAGIPWVRLMSWQSVRGYRQSCSSCSLHLCQRCSSLGHGAYYNLWSFHRDRPSFKCGKVKIPLVDQKNGAPV